jgi:hypothetical protein
MLNVMNRVCDYRVKILPYSRHWNVAYVKEAHHWYHRHHHHRRRHRRHMVLMLLHIDR